MADSRETDIIALAVARQAERDVATGRYLSPMHGIPVAVKDQVYTRGIRTTHGSTILKDFICGFSTQRLPNWLANCWETLCREYCVACRACL